MEGTKETRGLSIQSSFIIGNLLLLLISTHTGATWYLETPKSPISDLSSYPPNGLGATQSLIPPSLYQTNSHHGNIWALTQRNNQSSHNALVFPSYNPGNLTLPHGTEDLWNRRSSAIRKRRKKRKKNDKSLVNFVGPDQVEVSTRAGILRTENTSKVGIQKRFGDISRLGQDEIEDRGGSMVLFWLLGHLIKGYLTYYGYYKIICICISLSLLLLVLCPFLPFLIPAGILGLLLLLLLLGGGLAVAIPLIVVGATGGFDGDDGGNVLLLQ